MAASALEEKIEKIRLQNEKIRLRYEEVEADKKNAAKLNALVQLVPSDDWPERKEPPEFSAPPKNSQKQRVNKEYSDRLASQHYPVTQERHLKKDSKFAQGEGPPPDPKYNFLADSERETRGSDESKIEDEKNRPRHKASRGSTTRRRGGGSANNGVNSGSASNQPFFKDNRGPHAFHSKGEGLPEYEAWRAERERIDEARINRQKTAEGNWRREWDVNKVNIERESESLRKGDSNRKDYEKRNNYYENNNSNQGHTGSRSYHGLQKNYGNQDYRRSYHEHNQFHEYKKESDSKQSFYFPDDADNTMDQEKAQVMSVKVNSPNIVGTGRVGPRQKSRITYSSQSDADLSTYDSKNFFRQKSFDEKKAGITFNDVSQQKSTPKSPFSQRKKEGNTKPFYSQRKEFRNDDQFTRPKNPSKSSNTPRNEHKDQRQSNHHTSKSHRAHKRIAQKLTTEATQSVPSNPDNAIPFEYVPNTSFVSANASEQIISHENDSYGTNSCEFFQYNVELSDELKNSQDAIQTVESVDEIVCNINVENSDAETNNDNKINVINESDKVNSDIDDSCANNKNIEVYESVETNYVSCQSKFNESTAKKEVVVVDLYDCAAKQEREFEIVETSPVFNQSKIDESLGKEEMEINLCENEAKKKQEVEIIEINHVSSQKEIDAITFKKEVEVDLSENKEKKKTEINLSETNCTPSESKVNESIMKKEVEIDLSDNIAKEKAEVEIVKTDHLSNQKRIYESIEKEKTGMDSSNNITKEETEGKIVQIYHTPSQAKIEEDIEKKKMEVHLSNNTSEEKTEIEIVETNLVSDQNKIDENIVKKDIENKSISNTTQEKTDLEYEGLQKFIGNNIELLEKEAIKNSVVEDKTEQIISSEDLFLLTSQNSEENESKTDVTDKAALVKNEIKSISVDESKKEKFINDSIVRQSNPELQGINIDLKSIEIKNAKKSDENDSFGSKEMKSSFPNAQLNASLNDSGITDIDSELEKTNNSESNESQNQTNILEQVEPQIEIIDEITVSNIAFQKNLQAKSDPVDKTKENCEISVEICDNRNDEQVKISGDNQAAEKLIDNSTKDNDVDVVKTDVCESEENAAKND